MTLPDERITAIRNTREFLRSLLHSKQTPRVPLEVRKQARACLRHFPGDYDMAEAAKANPSIFGHLEPEKKKS